MPATPVPEHRIAAVRRFSRFYTQTIGALNEGLLQSAFTLAETRVLYELAHRDAPTAAAIARELNMDAGYLSRILRTFQERGLVAREPSPEDGRQSLLRLTAEGHAAIAPLEERSRDAIAALLAPLESATQARLVDALETAERLLGVPPPTAAPYLLRPHRPGDMGWVVERHGVVYCGDYGWNERFEGLVAEIVAGFLAGHDPRRERCWIADRDGERLGSIFIVRQSDEVAKLRLLLVEPKARGQGIGRRLVDEAVRFSRQAGYRRITLWTNDVLHTARALYERAGFALVAAEPHDRFGPPMTGETWEMAL